MKLLSKKKDARSRPWWVWFRELRKARQFICNFHMSLRISLTIVKVRSITD